MNLAIDLDDVVLGFVDMLCKALRKEYDVTLAPQDIVEWDLSKVLDPIVGGPWWDWWKERDWLWAQATAVDGAIGGIRTLRQQGHKLEIVTSKPEWAEAQTWRWLGKWRPAVHGVKIVGMDERKLDRSDAPLIVDDKPETCIEWAEAGRIALLFSRPHNAPASTSAVQAGKNFPGKVIRVDDWRGVLRAIRKIEMEVA